MAFCLMMPIASRRRKGEKQKRRQWWRDGVDAVHACGGFFDHIPAPVTGAPSPDDIVSAAPVSFALDRLGVRVPTLLVSLWIETMLTRAAPREDCPTPLPKPGRGSGLDTLPPTSSLSPSFPTSAAVDHRRPHSRRWPR